MEGEAQGKIAMPTEVIIPVSWHPEPACHASEWVTWNPDRRHTDAAVKKSAT